MQRLVFLLTVVLVPRIRSQEDIIISPDPVVVNKGSEIVVSILANRSEISWSDSLIVRVNFTDCYWSSVRSGEEYLTMLPSVDLLTDSEKSPNSVYRYGVKKKPTVLGTNITVEGQRIGHCRLEVSQCVLPEMSLNQRLCQHYDVWRVLSNETLVKVLREPKSRLENNLFSISTLATILITYFCMGCLLDTKNLKEDVRRPISPLLGAVGQFLFMPVASFSYAKLMRVNPSYRLGLFVIGIVPSTWSSKVWSLLFAGDISLSVMITTINTVLAFAMVPFWMFILADITAEDHQFYDSLKVPWLYIVYSLVVVVGPTVLGFALQKLWKSSKRYVETPSKILLTILLLYNIALTLWYNYDLLFMITWRTCVCAGLFVLSGYLTGLLIAILARRSRAECSVISIETGLQNIYLSWLILDFSLDEPEADVSSIIGIPAYVASHVILAIAFAFRAIITAHRNSKKRREARSHVHVYRCNSTPEDAEALQMIEMNGNANRVE